MSFSIFRVKYFRGKELIRNRNTINTRNYFSILFENFLHNFFLFCYVHIKKFEEVKEKSKPLYVYQFLIEQIF